MKKRPVFESSEVSLRIDESRSSKSGACKILRSLNSTAANRVLKPERDNEVRMMLMSALICSSRAPSPAKISKKARSRHGTCC